jgi:hypothetical protein
MLLYAREGFMMYATEMASGGMIHTHQHTKFHEDWYMSSSNIKLYVTPLYP